MRKAKDLTGMYFGRLLVVRFSHRNKYYRKQWNARCACGLDSIVSTCNLTRKTLPTRSCGCITTSRISHRMSKTSTYNSWKCMRNRCFNKNHISYKWYGGRGITVCERWRDSFENFFADMGVKPEGLTIERINNNGNYEMGNCKWATMKEQNNNQRRGSSC